MPPEDKERAQGRLKLTVRPSEDPDGPVDAQKFFTAAKKWIDSLDAFVAEEGRLIRWEITELKRSSAIVEVAPYYQDSGILALGAANNWFDTVQRLERREFPAEGHEVALASLKQFVDCVPADLSFSIESDRAPEPLALTLNIKKQLSESIVRQPTKEYELPGTIRGTVAVINSWNPSERWFRLRLPLAPERPVKCLYKGSQNIELLGTSFEHLLDVTGVLRYKPDDAWPYEVDVESLKPVPAMPRLSVEQLIGSLRLPDGHTSISFVREARDDE